LFSVHCSLLIDIMELSHLEEKLGIKFNNPDLLQQALVHRSYLNENPEFHLKDNERLEFLGDAVLELAVTEYLFRNYPNPEGDLTNWRAAMVKATMLARVAEQVGLKDYLLLSKGEARGTERARQYILADAIEALLGAIYLDRGYEEASRFIEKEIIKELPVILEQKSYKDAKSLFQEKSQELESFTPAYKVLKEWGPDHAKKFIVGVYINDRLVAKGQGVSKQEAEQKAAEAGLKKKKWE